MRAERQALIDMQDNADAVNTLVRERNERRRREREQQAKARR